MGIVVTTTVGAHAIRRGDQTEILLADSQETLNKLIALRWVGEWTPEPGDVAADEVRQAILDERWGDAVSGWMDATDEVLDIYPFGVQIHEARDVPDGEFGPRVQTTPLFRGS